MSTPPLVAPATVSDAPIWNVFLAAFHVPALVIADELGLFAAIDRAPATADQLAAEVGVEPRAIETIAGLLTALELLAQVDGRFHLTDVARTYLLPASPYYWGGMLRRIRDNPLDCVKLTASLRRGKAAADARVTGIWEAPEPPAAAMVAFTHAMHAHSFALAMRIVPALALGSVERLLDVAGGSGSYSIAAALHHPAIRCTVLDLPPVCEVARTYADTLGAGARVATVPRNMFTDPWPSDFERVLFSDIFHDWDDERCAWLAARAHEALRPGGRVILHEMILADTKAGPLAAIAYSMAMIFSTQGRQRSGRELAALLAGAGFTDVEITMTSGGYAAIAGTRP
jgi:hypothetical protein